MMYPPPQMMMMRYPDGNVVPMVAPVYPNNYYPAPPYMAMDPSTGLPVQIQQYPMQPPPRGPVQSPNPYNKNKQQQSPMQPNQQQQTPQGMQQRGGQYMNNNRYSTPYQPMMPNNAGSVQPLQQQSPNVTSSQPPLSQTPLVTSDNVPYDASTTATATSTIESNNLPVMSSNGTNQPVTQVQDITPTNATVDIAASIATTATATSAPLASFSFTNDDYHNNEPVATVAEATADKTKIVITAAATPTFIDHHDTIAAKPSSNGNISPSPSLVPPPLTAAVTKEVIVDVPKKIEPPIVVPETKSITKDTSTVTSIEAETESLPPGFVNDFADKNKISTTTTTSVINTNSNTATAPKIKVSSLDINDSDQISPETSPLPESNTANTGSNKRDKVQKPVDKSSVEPTSGWRRAETTTLPQTVQGMLAIKDGVIRYDKMGILKLNKRNKIAPKEIVLQYPFHSQKERFPFLPRGVKEPELAVDEGTQEEFLALMKDTGFKFDPSRLAATDDPDVVIKKANLILNKLSLTNFDKLSDEFMAVGIVNNDETLNRAVDLIVLKAQMEEHFCFMYADLCRKMIDLWSSEEDIISDKAGVSVSTKDDGDDAEEGAAVNNGKPMSLGAKFRFQLLDRCRIEFEIDRKKQLQDVLEMDIPADVKLEKEIILKKRYNGHMRFIGEIYMKDLVKPKIMRMCLDSLLDQKDEESLVCLCKLLRTIGQKLEQYDEIKRRKNVRNTMSKIMELISSGVLSPATTTSVESSSTSEPAVVETKPPVPLSSRIKFMLQDLVDMWKDGWKARIEEAKAKKIGPSSSNNDMSNSNEDQGQPNRSSKMMGGPNSGLNTPSNRGGPAPSPKFQDARAMSGSSRTILKDSNPVSTPTAAPVDEWVVAGPTKKNKNATVATPATSASTGTGFNRTTSSDVLSRGGGGSSSNSQGTTVGGMFSALGGNKNKSASSSNSKIASSMSGKDLSNKQSSATSGTSGRTVVMTGSSNNNSKSSNNNSTTKGPSNSNTNNKNSNGTNTTSRQNSSINESPRQNTLRLETPGLVIDDYPDTPMATQAATPSLEDAYNNDEDYSIPMNKDSLKAIKCILEEFFINQVVEDCIIEMQSKCSHIRSRMGDVLKYLINVTLEKKLEDRKKFNDFLLLICTPQDTTTALVSVKELKRGILLFLNDLDEISIDVPFATSYFTNVVSVLLLSSYLQENGLNLTLFDNISEENSFSMSIKAQELLAEILSCVVTNVNNENDADADANDGLKKAELMYRNAGGIEFMARLPPPVDPLNEVLTELAQRFQLPFLNSA